MSKKRQRRINETVNEFEDAVAEASQKSTYMTKSDEQLFVVDRVGSKSSRRRLIKEATAVIKETTKVSESERKLVEKAQNTIKKVSKWQPKKELQLHDLWEDSDTVKEVEQFPKTMMVSLPSGRPHRVKKNEVKKKRPVPIPGQSYNPSESDHQDALAEALALELHRLEELNRNTGISDIQPRERTVDNFDDESEDDDELDDEEGGNNETKRSSKTKLKTRAQRNKTKAHRMREHENMLARLDKSLLKSVDMIPHVISSLKKDEKRKEQNRLLKEAKMMKDDNALSYEEAGKIPLTDELAGSLRTIIPKGSCIKSHVEEMTTNGHLMSRNRRKKKAFEKPHKAKNMKWIAKYKYT